MVQPTVARLMQATRARAFRPGMNNQWGFVYRENRVPHYQKMMQKHDGKRTWWKSPRSVYFLYPYYLILWGSLFASTWGTIRMMFGHKTFW